MRRRSADLGGSGLGVELGPAFGGRSFAAQLGVFGNFSLPVGALEVSGRYFLAPTQPFLGATLAVRYRTPSVGPLFTIAGGLGWTIWSECLSGDFCLGLGPFVEVSPTLEYRISDTAVLFAALNGDLGILVFFGRPTIWYAGTLSVGLRFDFGVKPVAPAPES